MLAAAKVICRARRVEQGRGDRGEREERGKSASVVVLDACNGGTEQKTPRLTRHYQPHHLCQRAGNCQTPAAAVAEPRATKGEEEGASEVKVDYALYCRRDETTPVSQLQLGEEERDLDEGAT